MATVVELKGSAKVHLEALAKEIVTLIGHVKPSSKGSTINCWTTNSQDVKVALTVLQAAGSSINDAVTRFNLVFKANPGVAASESMTQEMGGFCQQMVSSLMLLPSVGGSEALVMFHSISVRALLHSLKDLVDALLDPSKHAQVNTLTGVVWAACKELQQAPKTNKLACRRQMMQWSVTVKDTMDEFQEAAKEAKAANDKSDGTDTPEKSSGELAELMDNLDMKGEGLDDDFDFDEGGMDYSSSEVRCVEATIEFLRALRRCLKAANESLNTLDSPGPSAHSVAKSGTSDDCGKEEVAERLKRKLVWTQSVLDSLSNANDCASELGILLYPPLSGSDLSTRGDDLGRALVNFCDVFERPQDGEHAESMEAIGGGKQAILRQVVDERMEVLRAELTKL